MQSPFEILGHHMATIWTCYDACVNIVNFPENNFQMIGASGTCPHCAKESYFRPITSPYSEKSGSYQTICDAAQCEACKGFVLVVGQRNLSLGNAGYNLKDFFPLGRPNDHCDPSIPGNIADDFKEALRCRWTKGHKATVTMCRRAIQASCLEKGADKKKKLTAQIDELATKGVITQPLKEFAHEVRLEGNDGAHPDSDGLENVQPKDADDIIEFTREYLHHVYVMPAKLAARKGAASPVAPVGP